ncbi:MAG: hypothetical protein KGN37_13025 [Burkholderiales bacterium]|nr:hypothetical protein [Burkholderiales bacterium]
MRLSNLKPGAMPAKPLRPGVLFALVGAMLLASQGVHGETLRVAAQGQGAAASREAVDSLLQGDENLALSAWLSGRSKLDLPSDDDQAFKQCDALMRYGLYQEAGDFLDRLAASKRSPQRVDLAWMRLAKLQLQRWHLDEAGSALKKVHGPLPEQQDIDRNILKAQILDAASDKRAAVEVLKTVAAKWPQSYLARYNLGVLQVAVGAVVPGWMTLNALGTAPVKTDEERILRDRANVALGFVALREKQPDDARRILERVSLDGIESNRALLGYGWALMDQNNAQGGLVPWIELSKRDPHDPAVQEAQLMIPYAYDLLGAKAKSVEAYAAAIKGFEREMAYLESMMAFIRSGQWVDALMKDPSGLQADKLPDVPYAADLTDVLADTTFQALYQNLLDLRGLQQRLQHAQAKADELHDILGERQRLLADVRSQLASFERSAQLDTVRRHADALSSDVVAAEAAGDGAAFADASQVDRLNHLTRVLARAQELTRKFPRDPDLQALTERVTLMKGLMKWQWAQAQADRIDGVRDDMQFVKAGLAQVQQRQASISNALQQEPDRFARLDGRVVALKSQVDDALNRTAELTQEQRNLMQGIALSELSRRKSHLTAYLTQARFAVASLYDQAASGTAQPHRANEQGQPQETQDAK